MEEVRDASSSGLKSYRSHLRRGVSSSVVSPLSVSEEQYQCCFCYVGVGESGGRWVVKPVSDCCVAGGQVPSQILMSLKVSHCL